MSSALAIASVTQVLKDLLNNGLIDHNVTGNMGVNVTVTALPPDKIDTTTNEQSQLNLFMYQATQNQGWRNQGLPSHNSGGERIANPPLPLDLHYLLTAYGADELHHEILLGYGMQLLHETPVLPREAIRRALAPPTNVGVSVLPPNLTALSTSELADQIELIKITPETMNTEEASRLWTAFGAKYRPNAAYKVTVVLIESKRSTKPSLPVAERKIYVVPFKRPVIEKIASQVGAGAVVSESQKVLVGYNLVLSGRDLRGDVTAVNIDGIEVVPATNNLSDTQIIVPVPAGLQAGIHGVQVAHRIMMGSPPLPHQGVSSNVQAFVLSPTITEVSASNVQGPVNAPRSATINLTVLPAIRQTQHVILFLNELNAPAGAMPVAYSFGMPALVFASPPAETANISIPVTGVEAGTYLVRLQVDGAESPLGTDPTLGYNSPQVTI